MRTGYFATAWNDIKSSPGWVGKMFLLALINLIPIFGQIVVAGYLYGWARDMAWGIQSPLPKKIFGNEDGRLYSRGFFIWVLGLVLGLVVLVLALIMMAPFMGSIVALASGDPSAIGAAGVLLILGFLFMLVLIAASLLISFFQWVGSMRISIYGRLSAGFQIKKIWKMLRKNFGGILRIFGMILLLNFIINAVIELMSSIFGLAAGTSLAGLLSSLGYGGSSYSSAPSIALGLGGILMTLAIYFLQSVALIWVNTMFVRALGYWTRQFDVANWRGQDDPMPFELYQTPPATQSASYYQQAQAPQSQQPPVAVEPYAQPQPQQGVPVYPTAEQAAPATTSQAVQSAVDQYPVQEQAPVPEVGPEPVAPDVPEASDTGAPAAATVPVEPVTLDTSVDVIAEPVVSDASADTPVAPAPSDTSTPAGTEDASDQEQPPTEQK